MKHPPLSRPIMSNFWKEFWSFGFLTFFFICISSDRCKKYSKHKKDLKDRVSLTPNQKGLFMEIQRLHKNIYRLADYALFKKNVRPPCKRYETSVWKWRKLEKSGISDQVCQEIVGISQATYYRYERHLKALTEGIASCISQTHVRLK